MSAAGSATSKAVEIGKQATDYLLFVLNFQVPSAEEKAKDLNMTKEEKKVKDREKADLDNAKTAYSLVKSIKGTTSDEIAVNFLAEGIKQTFGKLNKAMLVLITHLLKEFFQC